MRVGRKAARDTTDKWPEHAPHNTHATRIRPPLRPAPRCRAGVRIQTSTQPIGNALIEFDTPPTPTRASLRPPAHPPLGTLRPALWVLRSPCPAHAPLLSCDGGRPSHGRATLLLSGRLEAYDKFRWRAGGCRGSLAAVLCVVGPQGRQIAPPRAPAPSFAP